MRRYLAMETSSPRLSLALGDETKMLVTYKGPHDWRHAESLFDGMRRILARQRWPIDSLSGVAVSIGPGSFTGIRIGLAAARTLGQALKIPVVGVSSLEILAAGAKTKSQWLAPQIDALRGNVFGALYKRLPSGALMKVLKEAMSSADAWPATCRRRARREPVWIPKLGAETPAANVLLALARLRLAKANARSYETVLPLYVRDAAAVERRR